MATKPNRTRRNRLTLHNPRKCLQQSFAGLDELREQLERGGFLRRYLEATGRQIISGGQLRCPNPSAHANGDERPSAHLYEDASGDRVKCFGCAGSWDIFSLVQLDEVCDFMGALESLAKRFGRKFPKPESHPQKISHTKKTPARDRARRS